MFFRTAELKDPYVKIRRYKNESKNSFSHFSSKLLSHLPPEQRNPVFIRLNKIKIYDGQISLNDSLIQKNTLKIDGVNLLAEDFYIVNDLFQVNLKDFSLRSDDFGNLTSLKTKVNIDPCEIGFESFQGKLEESIINGSFKLEKQNPELGFLNNQSLINLTLNKSSISGKLIKKFISVPQNFQPLKISFNANGLLSDLQLNQLIVKNQHLDFAANLNIENALSSSFFKASSNINNLTFTPSNLNSFLPNSLIEKIPKKLLAYEEVKVFGDVFYEGKSLTTNLNYSINNSNVIQKGVLTFQDNKPNQFNGTFNINNLSLKPLDERLDGLDAKLYVSVNNILKESIDLNYNLSVSKLIFNQTPISNLSFNGNYRSNNFYSDISVNDNQISAKSAIRFSLSDLQKKYQFDLNVGHLNLGLFNENLAFGKAIFSGDLTLFLVGSSFDEIQGNLLFKNLKIVNANESYSYNDFIIETKSFNGLRSLKTINSNLINFDLYGEFLLSELPYLFQNAIAEVYSFIPTRKVQPKQNVTFDLSLFSDNLNPIFPDLSLYEGVSFRGVLSADKQVSRLRFNIPKISYKEISFQNIDFLLDNQNPFFNTYLTIGIINTDAFEIKEFITMSKDSKEGLLFRTEFEGGNSLSNMFELNYIYFPDNDKSTFELKKSIALINGNHWLINPNNESDHFFQFDNLTKQIDINKFEASSGEEKINFSMSYFDNNDFDFQFSADKVLIEQLDLSNKNFQVGGLLNLDLAYERSKLKNNLNVDGNVYGFSLNDIKMGDLSFFTDGNTQSNSFDINLLLSDKGNETLVGKGKIIGINYKPNLDIDLYLKQFNLSFLNPIGRGEIDNIRGLVSGEINLKGSIKDLKHDGKLILENGGLAITDVNTDYTFKSGTIVNLNNQTFNFQPTIFKDIKFGTQGLVSGKIEHNSFRNWTFDFDISADRILMMNIKENDDSVFFGDGFIGGKIDLYGPSKNLSIDVVGSTKEGTNIKIPWSKDYGLVDTSFIKYVDKKSLNNSKYKSSKIGEPIKGLEMNFELDVNPNAEIGIVIDKETGSYLSGRGAGNILMEIDTKGKFNMWGDFITFDGIYNFKNLSLIDKKFNLKQGGTIVWEGDPLSAQMDLEAVYIVPGGANPALLLDNPNFNRKIPTEVLVRLQGNLLKPDDPIFQIDFPNTNAVVTSDINYRLADPQTSQLQAISLLSQGIFINEVSVSVEGITNNLYEKASDIFSNIMGNDEGKLKVGLNYLQGDRSQVLDVDSEDRLGFTLSTQITDKILINGKIGVPVGGIEETLIVGDLQIDFILNEEGSLKAKVFNKENEFRYIGDELGYTQGLGLSYRVDFETFKDLIFKIVNGSNSDGISSINTETSNSNESGVKFINKN